MNRVVHFFKTAGIYFLGNVFTKLISFLLLPLYTSKIEPSAYGNYSLSITILNIVVPIIFICIWDSVFRFSFDFEKENEKYNVINDGFVIMLSGTVISLIFLLIIANIIQINFLLLKYFYFLAMAYQYYYTFVTRSLKDNNLFILSGCLNSLISTSVSVILILKLNMGIESLYISYCIGVLFQIFIIEYKKNIYKHLFLRKIKKSRLIQYIKFSLPITISSLSNWLLNGLTQFFISYKLGTYYNGIYGISNKFSSILILGIGIFQFAWNEMAYELSREKDKKDYYQKSINIILKISVATLSILLILIKLLFPYLVDSQYNESLTIIPILLTGTMANAYAGFFNIIFLNIFVHFWGFIGAVLSLCTSFMLFATMRIILLKKKMDIVLSKTSFLPIPLLFLSIMIYYHIHNNIYLILFLVIIIFFGMFIMKLLFLEIIKYSKNILKKKKRL